MQLKNSAAWIPRPRAQLAVASAPFPTCGDDELIIQMHYVAINPVDWKIQSSDIFNLKYPYILGEDVVGEVMEVGEDLKEKYEVGGRVMANALGLGLGSEYGAFQKFVVVKGVTACVIPGNVSMEEAVVLPLSVSTASAGLYMRCCLGLRYPELGKEMGVFGKGSKTLLLWGGSTSVGSSVLQLAKASGVHVVTTASPGNYEYCKKLGATLVLDYHNPDVVEILISLLRGTRLAGAYEAVGSDATVKQCASVLHALDEGKTVVSVGPSPEVPKDVKVVRISSSKIVTEEPEVAEKIWGKFLSAALEAGEVRRLSK